MNISIDIVLDVLGYLDPIRLNKLLESGEWWRYIISSMFRYEYKVRGIVTII